MNDILIIVFCCILWGERALHHFVSFNAFQHLIGIFYRRSNDWLSVFRGFLMFLEGSKTAPIRRTITLLIISELLRFHTSLRTPFYSKA